MVDFFIFSLENMRIMDKKITDLIQKEIRRQNETLDMIASENFVSPDIRKIMASPLMNKYSEGLPGKRYYPGNEFIDQIEEMAQKYALKAFGLSEEKWGVNVQAHSGSPANMAVYSALMKPGETLMGLKLADGGHLTHGANVSMTAKFFNSVQYSIKADGIIDYKELEKLAMEYKPKVIISGTTAYPRIIDFKKIGEIAKKCGAYHLADISHVAGLIVAGAYPAPFAYADAVTMTTHKTLRGPRGAVIISRKENLKDNDKLTIAGAIDKAVFPGLQGGPHDNQTAAIAQCFYEASTASFKKYAVQVVKNAVALAESLKKNGFELVSGGTDSHLLLVALGNFGVTGMEAEDRLERSGIIANRNTVPGDMSPFKPSGIRLGTASLTTRGMKEKEMRALGKLIKEIVVDDADRRKEASALVKKFSAKKLLKW